MPQDYAVAAASSDLEAHRATIDGYVRLPEDLFLGQRLPAWGKALRARAAGHVVDSGLAAWSLGSNPQRLTSASPARTCGVAEAA